jgi:uncharacterized membrane protein YoaK (UPF0700 family)
LGHWRQSGSISPQPPRSEACREERTITEIDGPTPRESALRLRHALILLLAAHAGAMDAMAFLALQAFTSVQTGNMVLAGVGIADGDGQQVAHSLAAIACFAVGCVAGVRITGTPQGDDGIWPEAISRALWVQVGVMSAFAVGWWLTDGDPGPTLSLVFIIANSFGMGIQSAAIQRFGTGGLSTTYLTGMLTVTMVRLATGGLSRQVSENARIIASVVVGAVVIALLMEHLVWAVPVAQIASVVVVILIAHRRLEGVSRDGAKSPGAS